MNRRFVNYFKIVDYRTRDIIEFNKDKIPKIEDEYRKYVSTEFKGELSSIEPSAAGVIDWLKIDKRIKSLYYGSWSGLDSVSRVGTFKQRLTHRVLDDFLKYAYRTESSYTHPTPYSAVPHFGGSTSYMLTWDKNADDMRAEDGILYMFLDCAVDSFCMALGEPDSSTINNLFEKLINESLTL